MSLQISAVDATILVLFLVGSVLFGIWIGRSSRTLDGYLLGGRNLPWWIILGSIIATETSTVTFLSVPGTISSDGGNLNFLQLAIGYIIGRLLVTLIFMPRFFSGRPFTAYEILRKRFGPSTSRIASCLFVLTRTLADGLRLYLTAIVLEKAVGISLEASILTIGIATIVYTFFGGMKSVVWNDCIQLVIYLAGAIVAGVVIVNSLGLTTITEYASEHDKLRVFDFSLRLDKPYTLLAGVVGGVFLTLATHGTDQLMVQRYLCAGDKKKASLALALSGPIVFLQFLLFLLLGVGLACFYGQQTADARVFDKTDEIFATFIVEELPLGLTGLVMAAVFSAAMSTLSSSLNSSATAVVNDLLRRKEDPNLEAKAESNDRKLVVDPEKSDESTQQKWATYSRIWTLCFGILQIIVALLADRIFQLSGDQVESSVISGVLSIAGFVTGIILGIFFLGVLTKRPGDRTAVFAMSFGFVLMTYLAFGTELAWTWYAIIGSTATLAVGVVADILANQINSNRSKQSSKNQ